MLEFICLFFPAFISILIEYNKKIEVKKLVLLYFLYNSFINLISIVITIIYKKGVVSNISENFDVFNFCLRYLGISIIIAFVLPYLFEFIVKNFNCKIEIKKGKNIEKKSK